MKINFTEFSAKAAAQVDQALVLLIGEDKKLSPLGQTLNTQSGGVLAKALATGKFSGKRGQYCPVIMPHDAKSERVILAGSG